MWAYSDFTDNGVQDGPYLQYSTTKNHMNMWHDAVMKYVEDAKDIDAIYSKGYKSLERGGVLYNCMTCCYTVTCSKALVTDRDFRRAIIDYFDLTGNQVEFITLSHYFKQALTGNPALDAFYYNSDQ